MIQDDSVAMPNRHANTVGNAERVHSELLNQAAARQAYEQQQVITSARRERTYIYEKQKFLF
jgi:hypothetical protein